MKATAIALLALALTTAGVSLAPSAAAADACVVGDDAQHCAASVQVIYCFTQPCDAVKVCVLYGRVCS